MPSFLIGTTFLGQPCGWGSTHGVNPDFRERLLRAEEAIRASFTADVAEEQRELPTDEIDAAFARWAGTEAPHVCWLPNATHHSAGAAIDLNPITNPYIVTRNGNVPSGEPGGDALADARLRALAAFDRAIQFDGRPGAAADLRRRQPNESTGEVWDRFKRVSDALANYLAFAIDPAPRDVSRVAIENPEALSDDELLATISEPERLGLDDALARLESRLGSAEFVENHPAWHHDARSQYLRILRDYECARIPLVVGEPSRTPAVTRNPARGFLVLRREIVTALCDQGLRWGACDFDLRTDGSSENGALMHFDLADYGGYPEINSLLRFG